jgi:hypothetical protein
VKKQFGFIVLFLLLGIFAELCSAEKTLGSSYLPGRELLRAAESVNAGSYVLVSSTNSPEYLQRQTNQNYLCDGTNDEATIWKAINEHFTTKIGNVTDQGRAFITSGYHTAFYDASDTGKEYQIFVNARKYTSPDGVTWSSATYDTLVGMAFITGCVWKEGNWYYCLNRDSDNNQIDLYTSPDGDTWTKRTDGVISASATAGDWDYNCDLDACAIIKVDTNYHIYYNNVGIHPRSTGIATIVCTDLTAPAEEVGVGDGVGASPTNIVKHARNPIFDDNVFCPTVFKIGTNYYFITSHFSGEHHLSSGHHGHENIELYRCTDQYFLEEDREYLGEVYSLPYGNNWNVRNIDIISIFYDDVDCDSFPNSTITIAYFATNGDDTQKGIGILTTNSDNLSGLATGSKGGLLVIAPGSYNLSASIVLREQMQVYAEGAVFNCGNDYETVHRALIPATGAFWSGGDFYNTHTSGVIRGVYGDAWREMNFEDVGFYDFGEIDILINNTFVTFNRCKFIGHTGRSILVQGDYLTLDNCLIDRCQLTDVQANYANIKNCIIRDSERVALADTFYGLTVSNCLFQRTDGAVTATGDRVSVSNCRILNPAGYGDYATSAEIYLQSACGNSYVANNEIVTTKGAGVFVRGNASHVVLGNRIDCGTAYTVYGPYYPTSAATDDAATRVQQVGIREEAGPYGSNRYEWNTTR